MARATRKGSRSIHATNELWEQEHGPKGGDEINIIRKGGNYGWPVVSHGVNYDGTPVGTGKQHQDGMVDPLWHWTPSIAPSGMAFYTGELFPTWQHSLFNGALKFELLSRLELKNDRPANEERMFKFCAGASATSGRGRTVRSICSPTRTTGESYASRRRGSESECRHSGRERSERTRNPDISSAPLVLDSGSGAGAPCRKYDGHPYRNFIATIGSISASVMPLAAISGQSPRPIP